MTSRKTPAVGDTDTGGGEEEDISDDVLAPLGSDSDESEDVGEMTTSTATVMTAPPAEEELRAVDAYAEPAGNPTQSGRSRRRRGTTSATMLTTMGVRLRPPLSPRRTTSGEGKPRTVIPPIRIRIRTRETRSRLRPAAEGEVGQGAGEGEAPEKSTQGGRRRRGRRPPRTL